MPFEFFPNTNFHDLNLDYILEKAQKIDDNLRDSQASADAAKASEEAAAASEAAAQLSEEAAAASEAAAKDYADHIADPVSGLVTDWLEDNIAQETGYALDSSFSVSTAAAQSKAVGDSCLHYVSVTQTMASDTYGGLIANLPRNSFCWASLAWFSDGPSGTVGQLGFIANMASNTGSVTRCEYFIDAQNGDIWCRRHYSGGYYTWKQIFRLDNTLTDPNAAAPAKTVGDICMSFLSVNQTAATETYGGLIANLPANRFAWIRPSWFSDAPPVDTLGFIFTPGSGGSVRSEIFVTPTGGAICMRQMYTEGDYSSWNVIPKKLHNTGAGYYAFGDSTTNGQIGDFSNPGQASAHPYPSAVGKLLDMTVHNQAVRGQGLIGSFDAITAAIDALDMSDARLITVGWAYNDLNNYASKPMGSADSTGSGTVVGCYQAVMQQLQQKCPQAQIVLVTGYGYPGGNASQQIPASLTAQFTHEYIFQDGRHTVKEFYDTLEAMCWANGWCCVNQAKGCAFNKFNASYMIGDQIHPTENGYIAYSNNLAPRIANYYNNIAE